MAAYCVVKGLDYVVEECPLVAGNTVLRHKDALNELERHSPGTKAQFLFGFLDRIRDTHFAGADEAHADLVACHECGMPTTAPRGRSASGPATCAFCRARGRVLALVGHEGERQPGGPGPPPPPPGGRAVGGGGPGRGGGPGGRGGAARALADAGVNIELAYPHEGGLAFGVDDPEKASGAV
jgi:hypothetical protein